MQRAIIGGAKRAIFCLSVASGFAIVADMADSRAAKAQQQIFNAGDRDFDDLTRAEKDSAKAEARKKKYSELRVCADPGNMPFSDKNKQGFENRIIEVIASAMGAKVKYAWRPTFERGLTRQTMQDLNICDVMVDIPIGYESLLTTTPLYRTTYVLAFRSDRHYHFKSLDDPALQKLRVGVYETSGIRSSLARHGVKDNIEVMATSHDADLEPMNQPWRQVEKVLKGQLDVVGIWGPFAGWVKTSQHAPLTLVPTNMMDETVPMEFSLALGVRRTDAVLKYALEDAMEAKKAEIAAILKKFGVPLVRCSDCLIDGAIPAHGDYNIEMTVDESAEKPIVRTVISKEQVEQWLKSGADLNDEFNNAVLGGDLERVSLLLDKGADVNHAGNDGERPLQIAVINGDRDMIALLLKRKADVNAPDSDGYTPLAIAAVRDKAFTVPILVEGGANLETAIPGGYTPLFIAVAQGKLATAKALIEAGAKVDVAEGPQKLTLLMAAATQKPPERRIVQLTQKVTPTDIAGQLIQKGVDVNAASSKGVTALMIAAAHDNAPMIGVLAQAGAKADLKSDGGQTAIDIATQNSAEAAVRALQIFK